MRLLYLSADPGIPVRGGKGASIHIRALTGALARLEHEVVILSAGVQAGLNPLPPGVRCGQIPAVRPRDCASSRELLDRASRQADAVLELARSTKIDAICERYSLAGIAGARTAGALGIPFVVEVNAPLRAEERRYRALAHEDVALAAERQTFAAAGRIFAVSHPLADWLVTAGVDPARIEVMPNAPPDRPFRPKHPLDERTEVVVGFAGGLKRWHGIDTLVEGFELALVQGARIRLEIVGDGPAADVVERAALPQDRLIRLGQLSHEDALVVLERWDVGLAPYAPVPGFYFSPLKLFEYMAAGLCPVVSDVGDLAEIVAHGKAGVVVPADDPGALARGLVELDRDRARLRELGAAAQTAAQGRPSWSDNARRIIEAVEALSSAVPGVTHG